MTAEQLAEYLIRLDNQALKLKEDMFRISWYMRGGVSINDLHDRYTFEDREILNKIINDNIEVTKNTQLPLL